MHYITIKDVAKRLNLSVSTISRGFNDKYDIKKETKDLILATAKEMGYRPNPMAKKLIQKRSFNIGIVVPEFINSFFPEVIIGAQDIFFDKGYQVLITQSNECFETELKNVKTLEDSMVDGLLISLCSESNNIDYYEKLIDSGFPIVFFNRVNKEFKTDKVVFNDYKWAFFATEHLIAQGYKNIIHLKGADSVLLSNERSRGFIDALKKHRFEGTKEKIIPCGFSIEDGERVGREIIESGQIPDAIFAANDPSAIGVMKTLQRNGYKIPKDIAIVGFSESKMATIVHPELTTVLQPTNEIGREAALMLIKQIENKGSFIPQTIELNGQLNIRGSSVKI
jgi:LacI family transcriptional regulator